MPIDEMQPARARRPATGGATGNSEKTGSTVQAAEGGPESQTADLQPVVYLVSACLLGMPSAYDGQGRLVTELLALAARGHVVPVCPEMAGGLPTPRPAAEIVGGSGEDVLEGRARVVTIEGQDVTDAYVQGAEVTLAAARRCGARLAVLKAHSPSCGSSQICDGSHAGRLVPGQGVTTALLRRAGLQVVSEENFAEHVSLPAPGAGREAPDAKHCGANSTD
jgi:uncharacterized protein YbbK (DUF523 family)